MSIGRTPPFPQGDIKEWARQLHTYLVSESQIKSRIEPTSILLAHKVGVESAAVDGIIMFDPTTQEIVVSSGGAWVPLGGGGGGPTNLSYTAATRLLESSTGTDVTLPLVGADAGLMSAADKTKLDGIASGAQVNVATDLSYTAATRILASSTGTDATLPLVGADAGLMSAADKTKLDGIASGAQVNVPTDLSYTAATRLLISSTGADVTLPLVGADDGLMSAADKTKLDGIASGAQVNVPTDLSYTAATRILASSTGADVTLPLFTSTEAGLAPLSGGGTSNFLRADGTWAAPAGGGGSTIYYGHLQADYTLTSTTAVQKLFNWSTNGALTLPTGVYRFRSMIYLTTMSATSGNGSFRLKGAGTATVARVMYHTTGIDNTSPLNAGAQGGSASITENSVASMVTAATGTGLTAIIEGFFDVTVTGTIIPSIALVTAAAAVVKAGSFFECEHVGNTATAASSGWS